MSQSVELLLTIVELVIPQVDYEPAIYYTAEDPYPHLHLEQVARDRVVEKSHEAVILENECIRLTVLPGMGRVYSLVYKPTGNEQFWRNDIVNVGGGQNDAGWWIWIGGAEYTLPGDEHGTTWALPWDWEVAEDSSERKSVRMRVREPGTGLTETLTVSVVPDYAWYQANVTLHNPTDSTVHFAHWVNPQWTPGGHNELTDSTEFIIPTEKILIEQRWQKNLGPSPQPWPGNPLRFIRNWQGMGDLMADSLYAGFYSAYSHDEEEGIVRVFDPAVTPGVDIWTYGFHTDRIPMGSGAPNKGYAEMWGGTSRLYPDETQPLAPGDSLNWQEWMYPYRETGGLTYADREVAVCLRAAPSGDALHVGICPAGEWRGTVSLVRWPAGASEPDPGPRTTWRLELSPAQPFRDTADVPPGTAAGEPGWALRLDGSGQQEPVWVRAEAATEAVSGAGPE